MSRSSGKLAPEVNRALFVKNLSYQVTPEELFDLFGRFGAIRYVLALSDATRDHRLTHCTDRSAKASPTTPRAPPSSSLKMSWTPNPPATS